MMKLKTLIESKLLWVILSGALTACSFSPLSLSGGVSIIGIAVLITCLEGSLAREALLLGFGFGCGFFGLSVSWVYVSIHLYGHLSWYLALPLTCLFIMVLSIYPALVSFIYAQLPAWIQKTYITKSLVFSCLWVLSEFLRSHLFTGFPWSLIAYGQLDSPLAHLAPLIGTLGIGFVVCFCAGLLSAASTNRSSPIKRSLCLLGVVILMSLPLCLEDMQWTVKENKKLSFSAIQGNITQEEKWDINNLSKVIDRYIALSESQWQQQLIIWPESALPLPYPYSKNIVRHLENQALESRSEVILGVPVLDHKQEDFFNGLIHVGGSRQFYFKRHLVPFGEYIPFQGVLMPIFKKLSIPVSVMRKGQANQALFHVQGINLAPFICYEIAFSGIVRDDLPEAQALITVSDDAWFGHSFAARQHLQIAQMRSKETGREQIMVGNDGVTALIDANGNLVNEIAPYQEGVLQGELHAYQGTTPWVVLGDFWILVILIMLTASSIFILYKRA